MSTGNNFANSNPTTTKSIFATVQSVRVNCFATFCAYFTIFNMDIEERIKASLCFIGLVLDPSKIFLEYAHQGLQNHDHT